MIVADATLLCHFFLRSDLSTLARDVRSRDGVWMVPPLWRAEFANAIVMAHRTCPDPLERYLEAWDSARSALEPCERPVDVREVIRLAAGHKITAYDAQYVHLAEALRVPLVTEDVELLRKFSGVAVSMRGFVGARGGGSVARERRAAYRARLRAGM
jgi:predicted nucleic acid-binding protein